MSRAWIASPGAPLRGELAESARALRAELGQAQDELRAGLGRDAQAARAESAESLARFAAGFGIECIHAQAPTALRLDQRQGFVQSTVGTGVRGLAGGTAYQAQGCGTTECHGSGYKMASLHSQKVKRLRKAG